MSERRLAEFLRFSSILFFSLLYFCDISSADSNSSFYSLATKWEKEAASGKTKNEAVEDGFKKALYNPGGVSQAPAPVVIRKNLIEAISQSSVVEIELGQLLILASDSGILKFLATEEGIVILENTETNSLRILGAGIGSTFVHVWNGSGRNTFEVRVKQSVIRPSSSLVSQKEAIDKTRSFKIGYDNSRSAFYSGAKYREMRRQSVDLTQNLTVSGDTPYGAFAANAQGQKSQTKLILTDAHAELKDGKIGPFRDFNVEAGDSRLSPNLMALPATRIRGGVVEHWDKDKQWKWNTFYGREQTSSIGILTPGLVSGERTRDSFLSGTTVDYKVNDAAKLKGGYFTGHGRSRPDDLNRRGMGLRGDVSLTPNILFIPETDYDDERFAQKHALVLNFEKIKIKNEYRNVDKNFKTLIGSPERTGELGYLIDFSATPFEKLSLSGSLDIFKDRQIPNPEKPDYYNVHKDLRVTYLPWESSSLILNYSDFDDVGRIGPTKQRTIGGQFNQRFSIWNHPATFFSRYQVRGNRILNNSTSDYINNQFTLGLQTEIFWGIIFSVEEEMNYLKEPNIRRLTHPRATLYTLDYNHQIYDTPFYFDARLRVRDEEETESINSFMTGEDSVEISGGLTYREYENMELFLTGSFESFKAESLLAAESQRVEAQFYTGMRYVFDTGYRWAAVGTVQGYVFKDLNADGIKQANEPGFGEMIVKSSDGKEIKTDAQGLYILKSVKGKTATISLDNSKIPFGYVPTASVSQEVEIIQNKTMDVSFGITPRSEITGIVFNDLNENGQYELNETGVRKVKIVLESGQSTRSGSQGSYSFPDVVAGEHTASLDIVTLPEGYLPLNVPKKTFSVFEGIRYQLNFPLRAARVITGRVFYDKNHNDNLDTDEAGVKNIEVKLGELTVKTDDEGWYLFDDLKPGIYNLMLNAQTLPAGHSSLYKEKIEIKTEPLTLSSKNIPVS